MNPLQAQLRVDLDDWRSWLVYADWLQDQGDARGEVIVLEHRLAAEGLSEEEARRVRARIKALGREHRPTWRQGLELPAGGELECRFGFPVGVRLPWSEGAPAVLARLVDHPGCRLLTRLHLAGESVDTAALARLPALRAFLELSLARCALGPRGAEALARSPHLGGLVRLDLSRNEVGPQGAAALAQSSTLGALERLELASDRVGAEGAAALAQSRTLRALDLSHNGLGPEGAAELARSTTLRSLDLSLTPLGDEGAAALAQSRTLTELNLYRCALGPRSAVSLAQLALIRLKLTHNDIRDAGAMALAESPALGALTWLSLSACGVEEAGALAIARSTTLGALQSLTLRRNGIGTDGLRALLQSTTLRSLAEIVFSPGYDEIAVQLWGSDPRLRATARRRTR
jgi:uncharacterized protein (TIGR02996 family)